MCCDLVHHHGVLGSWCPWQPFRNLVSWAFPSGRQTPGNLRWELIWRTAGLWLLWLHPDCLSAHKHLCGFKLLHLISLFMWQVFLLPYISVFTRLQTLQLWGEELHLKDMQRWWWVNDSQKELRYRCWWEKSVKKCLFRFLVFSQKWNSKFP